MIAIILTSQKKQARNLFVRKFIALVMCIALVLSCACFSTNAYAEVLLSDVILGETVQTRNLDVGKCPNIECNNAILIDNEGIVLFERNAYAPVKIASITKVMTALVALDCADLSIPVVVSENAASVGETSASLEVGDVLTLETAIQAMLIPSGNDAAVAIGETIGTMLISTGLSQQTDPLAAFVDAMNARAYTMGLYDTVFRNCHGLDAGEFAGDQHSTAYDVALMSKAAIENAYIASVVAHGDNTIIVKRNGEDCAIDLATTDVLLDMYAPAIGVKTGFTEEAGYCFAGAAKSSEQYLYCAVLNSPDTSQRFYDAQALFSWGYAHRISYKLAQSATHTIMEIDGSNISVPVVAEVAHSGWVDVSFKATLANPNETITVYDINGNISQQVEFDEIDSDVHVGDKVGTIHYYQRNVEIASADMVSCEEVCAPNLFQRIGVWFDRLIRGFTDKPTVAENVVLNQTPLLNNKAAA